MSKTFAPGDLVRPKCGGRACTVIEREPIALRSEDGFDVPAFADEYEPIPPSPLPVITDQYGVVWRDGMVTTTSRLDTAWHRTDIGHPDCSHVVKITADRAPYPVDRFGEELRR